MIIKSLEIENWRKIDRLKIDFSDKVNVVYGPNESGKSTLLESIYFAFLEDFTSQKEDIKEIIPIGTKVYPFVKISFLINNKKYILEKKFLSQSYAKLSEESNGNIIAISEGKSVSSEIEKLIGIDKNSFKYLLDLLWIRQGKNVIDNLLKNKELINISGMVKEILFSEFLTTNKENEKFFKEIKEELKNYITEKKGDIKKETLLYKLLEQEKEKEAKLNEINNKIINLEKLSKEVDELKNEIEKIETLLNQKEIYLSDLEKKRVELEKFNRVKIEYENLNQKFNKFNSNLLEIEKCSSLLKKAKEKRINLLKNKKILLTKKFNEYNEIKNRLENFNEEIKNLAEINIDDIKRVEDLEKENERLEIKLSSSRINLEIIPLKDQVIFNIKKDKEEEKKFKINKNLNIKANKIIKISTEDFKIEVSGPLNEKEFEEYLEKIEKNSKDIFNILKKYNVLTLNELKEKFNKRKDLISERDNLNSFLKNFNNSLIEELNSFSDIEIEKDYIPIYNDIYEIDKKLTEIQQDILKNETIVKKCEEDNRLLFGNLNKNDFENSLFSKKLEYESLSNSLKRLSPEDINDYDKILTTINRIKIEKENLSKEKEKKSNEKSKKEGELNIFSEYIKNKREIEDELIKIKSNLKNEYLNYYSLRILEEIIENKKKEIEENIFKPLEERISKYFKKITPFYEKIRISNDLRISDKIIVSSNNELKIENLSYGTKEQLYFLFIFLLAGTISNKKESLPVILDDSFVNTDLTRLKEILKLIKDSNIQFIIFTCDESNYKDHNFNMINILELKNN
ncbi:MAG TPA: AAA family ATPase [Spirochaetota bacterium]|nr:AAA family ATPase [Spirochaetota bacterium]HOL56369.1 AAA family ATPase [Spirochaetota bacterium]HPP03656.1 AAA family ATPase [Spirochaetota bacterium]